MAADLKAKARAFLELHRGEGTFVMPNSWDVGTSRILAAAGFKAIATTSAGINWREGRRDAVYELSREDALADHCVLAEAVAIPVNGDLENGFGDSPEDVAETIRQAIDGGLAGAGIEDFTGDRNAPLYDIELAVERIAAAREVIDKSGVPFVLTGRAECYLVKHPEPFEESVKRMNRYREAGADCLYAPGVVGAEAIGAMVRAVEGPLNVVMGLAGEPLSVSELSALGVKRISIGGSLARATYSLVERAARTLMEEGSFGYTEGALPGREIERLISG